MVTPKTKTEAKVEEPVETSTEPTDFTDLFNVDPEDIEWSTPKETVA